MNTLAPPRASGPEPAPRRLRPTGVDTGDQGPGEESNLACGRGEPSLGPPHPVRVVAVCLPALVVRVRTGTPAANPYP
jgi:hypothetical protein